MTTVFFQDLGYIRYRTAWDFQTQLHQNLIENKLKHRAAPGGNIDQRHQLLLCEHPPVFTLGRCGSPQNLLLTEAELTQKGIEFIPINRGGDITFHGPGQVVGYPILDLDSFFHDVHRYVRQIEEVIIRTLAAWQIQAFRLEKFTGVWVGNGSGSRPFRKICAIGVHLSRWVTLHGWALNVNTDLHYFDYIVPCGIADADKSVTSMAMELGENVDIAAVKQQILINFAEIFDCSIIPIPK